MTNSEHPTLSTLPVHVREDSPQMPGFTSPCMLGGMHGTSKSCSSDLEGNKTFLTAEQELSRKLT